MLLRLIHDLAQVGDQEIQFNSWQRLDFSIYPTTRWFSQRGQVQILRNVPDDPLFYFYVVGRFRVTLSLQVLQLDDSVLLTLFRKPDSGRI